MLVSVLQETLILILVAKELVPLLKHRLALMVFGLQLVLKKLVLT